MPNEYINSVVSQPPRQAHLGVIDEISPLTQPVERFSLQANMETTSRDMVLKIIIDVILLGIRKCSNSFTIRSK